MGTGYLKLLLAQAITRFGDGFFSIGVSWLVYVSTGSALPLGALWGGYLMLAGTVQTLVAPITDRMDRRRLTVGINLLRASLVGTPAILAHWHLYHTWQLYPVFVLSGLIWVPYRAAMSSMLPEVVPPDRLLEANARIQGATEIMYIVGPTVGGFTLAVFGALSGLLVDAAALLAAACLLMTLAYHGSPAGKAREPDRQSIWWGIRQWWGEPLLRRLGLMAAVVQLTDVAFIVLSVPLVRSVLHGNTSGVGLLEASLSVGFLGGTWMVGRSSFARRFRWRLPLIFCLATAAIGVIPLLAWALFTQVVAGIAGAIFEVEWNTHFQRTVENQGLARVLMAQQSFTRGVQSVGAVVVALLAVWIGVVGAFVALGLAGAALVIRVARGLQESPSFTPSGPSS